ncbi:MAG: DEAD/DEAH box helicase [Snodgrassella sp.]|uniref:DEAD/DEAH box helicase n=1 Tax=Snodgrassella sp. TaxID=2815304 RepID=UPI00258EC30C|nr:type ISP restriction/modification enzyme [Snodgrassella sp.]MCO6521488.1 DEAD/DEAH box helicase [Snodgrassella sp.]
MSPLKQLLATFRTNSQTEREKGTYFEQLIVQYLKNEAIYKDLYSEIYTYAQWAREQGKREVDTGIDLVARTRSTNELHAIQCKFYDENHCIQKKDIDSFFTASGKSDFTHRIIVSTSSYWSKNAEDALNNQQIPVSVIDLHDLENSQIDWAQYQSDSRPVLKDKKELRNHQQRALAAVEKGLATAERGKLIMACGTGKTFTSLKIAEKLAGKGKRVLFMVPSLSLLSQTLTEWTQQSTTLLHSFAVCSDSTTGKKKNNNDDEVQLLTHELSFPATTDAQRLAEEMRKRHDNDHMSVVFATYHSIDVIHKAQLAGLESFDLIICDEAHRTTGTTFGNDDESSFVKVHNNKYIVASKRLYMTATPRIYANTAKASAEKDNVTLCSMDDEQLYGKELFVINFSEAVQQGLLVDYKVIVLSIEEKHVSQRLQELLSSPDNDLKVDDAAKIIGCWKALSKFGSYLDMQDDPEPMRRAVAFCRVIEPTARGKSGSHKVSSKTIADNFQHVVEAYQSQEKDLACNRALQLTCEAEHIDGSMNASEKEDKIDWLKANIAGNHCRILSNVRCLSEGVDVPALDAVMFLSPRNSQVDVVQSVGRVMRKAEGKKRGYVILPVVIPAGMEPHEALNDNKTYKVVWQVLQALRAHDDTFESMINKMQFDGADKSKMEVIVITDKLNKRQRKTAGISNENAGRGKHSIGTPETPPQISEQLDLHFKVDELERAIYDKVVKVCGRREYWEDWAKDIGKIANTHICRIQGILANSANSEEIALFNEFANELRDDLNDAISNEEIIEMLAQHLITKPVFDALFQDYSFTQHNPMSQAMQKILDKLQEHRLDKEADSLEKFYQSVQRRAANVQTAQGKQKIVVELYDKFFRSAFPKLTERLGIVYTPVEVVDFIIHSINNVLKNEFGQSLADENVHILDPFTGTGTFITRLLQSGLIPLDRLPDKYQKEIHANELVLLAYYIAAINIEATYHELIGGNYQPFEGICLTDTFQMYEKEDLIDQILVDNSARRKRQQGLDIKVIMGNPPYSAGQDRANDNNANFKYPHLDSRITETYADKSTATLKISLYDSYIRAIRWASDRINDAGVIGFVSNGGFIDGNAAAGLRKCLAEEFSSIYIFHLRGNQRTSGERSRKEGGKIFGSGSRAPIAISLLVKNPDSKEHGKIYFHDIGDYLTREQKLEKIAELASINGITAINGWQRIIPDQHNDWLNQRDNSFNNYISLGNKKDKKAIAIFNNYSNGVKTNRDAWVYNASKRKLIDNVQKSINFYNDEVNRYLAMPMKPTKVEDFIRFDSNFFSWDIANKRDLEKGKMYIFNKLDINYSLYRPFTKNYFYFNKILNNSIYQIPKMFPNKTAENYVLCLTLAGTKGFSVLISDLLPDLHLVGDAQCFPLYLYEKEENIKQTGDSTKDMFTDENSESGADKYIRKDGISDAGLEHFQAAYPHENICKEDIFYYVYGLLHSEEYKERYADNLIKELPRIPCVKSYADFAAFSQAGRNLADLHLNYESQPLYAVTLDTGKRKLNELSNSDFYVSKMKFAKKGEKATVIYNNFITIRDIPLEAYSYIVNGKSALEWVMERQGVSTHKNSGIVNDANDWAMETMHNARYPLELFQRVITVSLETLKIVNNLPKLDI